MKVCHAGRFGVIPSAQCHDSMSPFTFENDTRTRKYHDAFYLCRGMSIKAGTFSFQPGSNDGESWRLLSISE